MGCDTVDSACNGVFVDNGFVVAEYDLWTGGQLHLHHNQGHLAMASSRTVDRPGQCCGLQGRVHRQRACFNVDSGTASVPITVATDQRSFQSHSSGVLTASRDMLYQLFGVGALAHRGLPPCSGVLCGMCHWLSPHRTFCP